MDISDTLAPKSDQLDAVDLLGGPQTFTITEVTRGNAEQPVQIKLAEFPRVWRPGKSMRRVLAHCWGTDASAWVGRRVTLYCDESVRFGNDVVGGTRISHLSHIDKRRSVPLLVKRGKSAVFTVEPLPDAPPARDWRAEVSDATTDGELKALWRQAGENGALTDELKATITARVKELQAADAAADVPTEEPPADDTTDVDEAWKAGQ